MKTLLTILALLTITQLQSFAGKEQEKAIKSFYGALGKHRYTKGLQHKGPATLLIRKVLEDTAAEHHGIRHVRFDYTILPTQLRKEGGGFAETISKPATIELKLAPGTTADKVFTLIQAQTGWHIGSLKDGTLTINCRHRPQTDE